MTGAVHPSWRRAPLAARLIIVLALCSGLSGLGLLVSQSARGARQFAATLQRQASEELDSLVPALADQALIGDYTAIQQITLRFASHANVDRVAWIDARGNETWANGAFSVPSVPAIFRSLTGLTEIRDTRPVSIGGRQYGTASIQLIPDAGIRHLWESFLESAVIIGAAWIVGGVVTLWILRRSMSPLKLLVAAVRRVQAGDLDHRLEPAGSPEIQDLITDFNGMSEGLARANGQILAALRDSHASRRELARFSEILTHHLQEPVRQIVSFSQLLERGGPESGESLALIRDGAVRLRSLLADIELYLALSHLPTCDEPQDPAQAVNRVLAEMRPAIMACAAEIEVGKLPLVWLDQRRMGALFRELLENAVEYRQPELPLKIRVWAEPEGDFARFTVQDNGIGVDPSYHERILGVFNRLHTREAHPGNGIGLAMARKIIAAVGGTISIKSFVGQGFSISFTLPTVKGMGLAS